MRSVITFLCCLMVVFANAQELKCTVTVNSQKIGQSNQQIFQTLQQSATDFMNSTKWTNKSFKKEERIACNMLITVNSYEGENFGATIQVQSSRPIYNSTYESPVLNINDQNFSFTYQEFQPMYFNETRFDSNLTSVLAFYAYIILGVDADSFKMRSGTPYYNKAKQVLSIAQSSNYAGWNQNDGDRTRWVLMDNLLSNTFREYRTVMYNYHRKAMDYLSDDAETAKKTIASSLRLFKSMNARRPNSYLLQSFFDAKANEILDIYSGGPQVSIVQLVDTLNKIAPNYSSSWKKIEY
ncbi:protein of unknown function [Pustulibacterium marinum]|uniref:DUF4835 domain-containing protein n=1 Tax=Pustulibacterium marinum TaxID=1224947 RepID=A0A1I7IKM5_9FLAO|nr:DUF4835 family protein [Pustulibacterium marinum]SFU73462.1 protein of unknown function [Pustulibacterium marinum]